MHATKCRRAPARHRESASESNSERAGECKRERVQGEDVQEESAACKFKLWATRCAFYRQISSDATQANCALRCATAAGRDWTWTCCCCCCCYVDKRRRSCCCRIYLNNLQLAQDVAVAAQLALLSQSPLPSPLPAPIQIARTLHFTLIRGNRALHFAILFVLLLLLLL